MKFKDRIKRLLSSIGLRGKSKELAVAKPFEINPLNEPAVKEYVRREFERLIEASYYETVKTPLFQQAMPDGSEYKWRWDWEGKPGREWDRVKLRISHEGLLRIIAGPVMEEPVFLTILAHKQTPLDVNIQSLLYADAGEPVTIWIFSAQPFVVDVVDTRLRLSPEVIRNFREKQMAEEGFVGSIPDPNSMYGREFYKNNPDLIP